MTDTTWAAKVLDGVGRIWAYSYEVNEADNGAEPEDWKTFQTWDVADPYPILGKEYVAVDDALAAIARMGAGNEELQFPDGWRERAHSFKGILKLQAAWADGFNAARDLAAIAKLGAGDGLVERLQDAFNACRPMNGSNELDNAAAAISDAIAHIAALTARNREMALDVLASSGQAQEAYAAQLAAEARISELVEECNQLEVMARDYAEEAAALRAKVARLEGALGGVSASLHQLARDRDLSEAELDFMRGIDAALTDGG